MDNAIEADSEAKMDEMREEVNESRVDRDVDQEALEEKEEEEEEEAALDLYGTLPPDPEDNDNEDETKDRVDYEEEGNEGITTESAEASGINCNGDNDLRPPMPSDSIQCPSTAPPALSSVPPPPSSSSSSSNERTPRYFVLKATSMADIISSKTHELWRVSSEPLFQKLSSAMQSSPEVIVFFTITGMRFYQGYGALRVVSEEEVKAKTFQEAIPLNPSPSENAADRLGASSALEGTAAPPVNNMNASASMMLGVAWKRCGLLSYDKAETVLNAFDKNRRVSAALDGQEVSPEAALRMMELLNECEEEEDVNALDEKMNKAMAERKSRSESVDDPLKTDIKRRREGEAPVRTNYPMLKIDITNMTYEEYLHGYHQSNLMKYQEMLAMKQMELMALNNPMAMMGMMGGGMHPPPHQQHPGGGGRGGHFRGRRY